VSCRISLNSAAAATLLQIGP
ncbi:hypothetical protein, partial [Acidisoma sp. L85]